MFNQLPYVPAKPITINLNSAPKAEILTTVAIKDVMIDGAP